MELTYEEARARIHARLREYPESEVIVTNPKFRETLANILELEGVDGSLLPIVESEFLTVITFYVPLYELPGNISKSTGLSMENSENIVIMIDALLFDAIRNDLDAFQYLCEKELKKERNSPTNSGLDQTESPSNRDESNGSRPLTREEVLRALQPKK